MNYDNLPKKVKEQYDSMRYASGTLEAEIEQALEEAEDLDDFIERVEDAMECLISEAKQVANSFVKAAKEDRNDP